MVPEKVTPVYSSETRSSDGMPRAVDAMLSERRPDGSVNGSYDAETMSNLLHYHVAEAAGRTVMAGEVVEA